MKTLALGILTAALSFSGSGAAPLPGQAAPEPKLFAVEVTGRGRPMILIPGLLSSGEVWKGTVSHYGGRYECHVLTLAGFAGQAPVDVTPFLPAVRESIAAYIQERKLEQPVVVGHSLGGFLALSLAAAHPNLVGKLVIVEGLPAPGAEANPDATPEEMKALADRVAAAFAASDDSARRQAFARSMATQPEHVSAIAAWANASDQATVTKAIAETITGDVRSGLARVQAPALVLVSLSGSAAASGREGLERTFQSQFRHMKTWELAVTSKARHFVMLDEPEWMFAQMDRFLGR